MSHVLRSYDTAGIAADSVPSADALACFANARFVTCSPLPRARESARRLLCATHAYGDGHIPEDLTFREVELADPPQVFLDLTLHPSWWVGYLRMLWLLQLYGGKIESPRRVWQRAHEAADKLAALAQAHGHVVLVGHSLMNYLIAWCLIRQGWRGKPRFQNYWEQTSFEKG